MGWIEQRITQLELKADANYRKIQDLYTQVKAAAQSARNAFQQYQATGGSYSPGYYVCYPSSGITAWSGSGTCPSVSTTVYQVVAGVATSIGTQTVYNALAVAFAASTGLPHVGVIVTPDGAGNYGTVSQGCT